MSNQIPYRSTDLGPAQVIMPRTQTREPMLPAGNRETPANTDFRYYSMGTWDFHQGATPEEDEWLPFLNEIRLTPGVNGVGEQYDGDGKVIAIKPEMAYVSIQQMRGILIDPQDRRLIPFYQSLGYGPDRYAYTAYMRIEGGGVHWSATWTRYRLTANGRKAIKSSLPGVHAKFKRHLYESGILPPMGPEVLDDEVGRLEGRIRLIRSHADGARMTSELFRDRVSEIQDRIQRMTAAYERQFAHLFAADAIEVEPSVQAGGAGDASVGEVELSPATGAPSSLSPDVEAIRDQQDAATPPKLRRK